MHVSSSTIATGTKAKVLELPRSRSRLEAAKVPLAGVSVIEVPTPAPTPLAQSLALLAQTEVAALVSLFRSGTSGAAARAATACRALFPETVIAGRTRTAKAGIVRGFSVATSAADVF